MLSSRFSVPAIFTVSAVRVLIQSCRRHSWLLFFSLLYLIPGLTGHDPWKQDETYVFGIIHHMVDSGDWVVPAMAGEPFMEKPPLYYWIATILVHTFDGFLPAHDAARLTSGILMGITGFCVAFCARLWWGKGHAASALLALFGCLGLIFHAHLMVTDVPLLTGFALSVTGFAMWNKAPDLKSAVVLGTGIGVSMMAKGVLGPGVFFVVAMLLPLLFPVWRRRSYVQFLLTAFMVALPWLLIWPVALWQTSQPLFMEWFWENNVGRFFGFSVARLGAPHTENFWITTLPWFTFPALPLALLTLWHWRTRIMSSPAIQVCSLVFLVMLAVLGTAASARDNYALPLLFPIAVLAAPAVRYIGERSLSIVIGIMFGAICSLLLYVWWQMVYNAAPSWQWLLRILPADFSMPVSYTQLLIVAACFVLTAVCLWQVRHQRGNPLRIWTAGLSLCWLVLCTLWLPWLDHAKSYRSVFSDMQAVMPGDFHCMASQNLGESERAMLRYFSGIITHRQETEPYRECDLLIVNGLTNNAPESLLSDRDWELVWDGARPGDARERLWLFRNHHLSSRLAAGDRPQHLR